MKVKGRVIFQKVADYSFLPKVHDHFAGSAHCVECGGHCTLTGADMAYTALFAVVVRGGGLRLGWPA